MSPPKPAGYAAVRLREPGGGTVGVMRSSIRGGDYGAMGGQDALFDRGRAVGRREALQAASCYNLGVRFRCAPVLQAGDVLLMNAELAVVRSSKHMPDQRDGGKCGPRAPGREAKMPP
jgi:hypothetical protein